jgi:hypothetical protein
MQSVWYPDAYFAYIRSPEWRRVVAGYFTRHPRRCAACQSDIEVDLHHKTYARLEAEEDPDLAPLCRRCHSMVHGIHRLSNGDLSQVTELWIESFRTQPNAGARQRATLKGVTWGRTTGGPRGIPSVDDVVHVGTFSYVARRGSLFVTWSTFRRRAQAVCISATVERAVSICESIDRRAQEQMAGSGAKPGALPKADAPVHARQSSGLDDDIEWFMRRPSNRAPSIRVQLANTFSRNRNRSTESFGYAKNLPSTQNYGDDT